MITGFYAALFGFLFLYLSAKVINGRRRVQVAIGDGEDVALRRHIRAHGNFCEHVPIALLIIGLAELGGAWGWLLHLLCLSLFLGRVLHAHGIAREPEDLKFRMAGMTLTYTSIALASITAFVVNL